jgi:hypothetical protein
VAVQLKADTELEGLRRIVALLFALAGLAERAAGAPLPVRAFVLWIVRRAESVARPFVFEPADDDGEEEWHAVSCGNSPADALLLAAALRELALALEASLALYRRFLQDGASGAGERDRNAGTVLSRLVALMRECPVFDDFAVAGASRLDTS